MIYLDNNSTTTPTPSVLNKLKEIYALGPLNSSSIHQMGRLARKLINNAREGIAHILKADPDDIIFTSGGSESLNLAIRSLSSHLRPGKIISSRAEHSAVQKNLEALIRMGWEITWLPPEEKGYISPQQIEEAIDDNTQMVVLMAVNNETGVLTDIEAIAQICIRKNLLFIVDAVAAFAKTNIHFFHGISAMCFSGHKYHAPQGVGLCLIRNELDIRPQISGGNQENSRRAGTHNVAGIAALYLAMKDFFDDKETHLNHIEKMRALFENGLKNSIGSVEINGTGPRSTNTSNLYFEGIDGETLLIQLDQMDLCASHGSACHAGSLSISTVLLSMGYSLERAKGSLRFSFSRFTKEEEIKQAIDIISACVQEQRQWI
jgi:cysteine desulfurase